MVTLKSPSECEQQPGIEYDPEDIEKLIEFVKDFTTLYDLRPEDWTFEHDSVISEFFSNVNEPLMMIYFIHDELRVTLGKEKGDSFDLKNLRL